MLTTTSLASFVVPVKDGVVLLDRAAGAFNVTAGAAVSTVNVTELLVPAGFPSELCWVAIAVYTCFPLDRAGLALPELQPPPAPVAVAVATTDPFAVAPR